LIVALSAIAGANFLSHLDASSSKKLGGFWKPEFVFGFVETASLRVEIKESELKCPKSS
jgi:hypothetical protein